MLLQRIWVLVMAVEHDDCCDFVADSDSDKHCKTPLKTTPWWWIWLGIFTITYSQQHHLSTSHSRVGFTSYFSNPTFINHRSGRINLQTNSKQSRSNCMQGWLFPKWKIHLINHLLFGPFLGHWLSANWLFRNQRTIEIKFSCQVRWAKSTETTNCRTGGNR